MAPKGLKRNSSAPASPKKRGRVDPAFAAIIATLQGVESLSDNCRDMLIAMAAPCLSTAKSERHSMQQLGVTMIEEMLQEHQTKLQQAVAVAQKELSELEGSKTALLQSQEAAQASLEEKKATFLSAHTTREEAKAAVKAAAKALAEAKDTQKKGDANHAALEKEKGAIEAAYNDHFKAPMDANEGPHHSNLKPFIKNLGLEESLTSAVPASCTKSKEQRGGFDDLVLAELGKALVGKIDGLAQSVAAEAAGVIERQAAVVSAEAVLESKNLSEKSGAVALEVAGTAQHDAEAALKKATEDWASFEPRVQEATDNHNLQDTIRIDFEEGALKSFATLRDTEPEVEAPVEEEAAPAGA